MIDRHISVVVDLGHTEYDLTFRLAKTADERCRCSDRDSLMNKRQVLGSHFEPRNVGFVGDLSRR